MSNCKYCGELIKYEICNMCSDFILNNKVIIKEDGNQYCCHGIDFKNLQEDIAGFGITRKLAYEDYINKL